MARPKNKYIFHLDEEKIFDYMARNDIKTIKNFCELVGISYMTIANARNGSVSLQTAWQLADFFGVMIEDIVIAETKEDINNEKINKGTD